MPRTRYVKPGIWVNEELAQCDPLARLLFIGLWNHADRKGRLEDRPLRIKGQILTYDTDCNVEVLLNQLAEHCFIVRYEVAAKRYISITNFEKHQKPHGQEPPSNIPAPPGLGEELGTTSEQVPTDLGTTSELAGPVTLTVNGELEIGNGEPVTVTDASQESVRQPHNRSMSSSESFAVVDEIENEETNELYKILPNVCGFAEREELIAHLLRHYGHVDLRYEAQKCRGYYEGKNVLVENWAQKFSDWIVKARSVLLRDGSHGPPKPTGNVTQFREIERAPPRTQCDSWNAVLRSLQRECHDSHGLWFDDWIATLKVVSESDSELVLAAPDQETIATVKQQLDGRIRTTLRLNNFEHLQPVYVLNHDSESPQEQCHATVD